MSPKPKPKPMTKQARVELTALLKDWDASGKVRTSAYWRLSEQLFPTGEPRFGDHVTGGDEEGKP